MTDQEKNEILSISAKPAYTAKTSREIELEAALASIEAKTYAWIVTEESAKHLHEPMREIRAICKGALK
jgi:hypothetical protein